MTDQVALPQLANKYLRSGYGCTEAVFKAYSDSLRNDSPEIQRIASVFQGGICFQGLTCGALIGGLMVIGDYLSHHNPEQEGARKQAMAKGTELVQWYTSQKGSTTCSGLLGLNLADPEQAARFESGGYFDRVCLPLVTDTCLWLLGNAINEEMKDQTGQKKHQ